VQRLALRGRDGKELDESATFVRKVAGKPAQRTSKRQRSG